jgi:hypothetical protein
MVKGRKKRSASNGGNTADKSHKQSSAEGNDNKNEDAGTNGAPGDGERMTATNVRDKSSTKGNGTMTPHDRDAETNLQKDPCCGNHPPPHKKNDQESMDKVTKGGKKRSTSYDGNKGDKSRKRSSTEGDDDKNKDTGTNKAPGNGERLTATDGRNTSSTKDDGATTPHDCNAETNLQKDADTHSSAEGDDNKNKDACTNEAPGDGEHLTVTDGCDTSSTKRKGATTPHDRVNAETNEQKDAGTVSQSIFETPVRNTTVSKNGFFQFGKTRKSNITKIFHNTSS